MFRKRCPGGVACAALWVALAAAAPLGCAADGFAVHLTVVGVNLGQPASISIEAEMRDAAGQLIEPPRLETFPADTFFDAGSDSGEVLIIATDETAVLIIGGRAGYRRLGHRSC